MAMFPALMNDTMFSDLFDDPFFEGWRNMDRAVTRDPNMSMGMMSTVSARRDSAHEDKDNNGKWLRRERYVGSCSRSFYVGEDMKDSDIHASYKDGTLCLELPKPQAQQQVESKHRIAIEG